MAEEMYLTQYGLMAERDWREFRPKMVREMETKGTLMEALFEAQETTIEDSAAGVRPVWEMIREKKFSFRRKRAKRRRLRHPRRGQTWRVGPRLDVKCSLHVGDSYHRHLRCGRTFGFERGRILEPALGISSLLRTHAGSDECALAINGIEVDTLTARIALKLIDTQTFARKVSKTRTSSMDHSISQS